MSKPAFWPGFRWRLLAHKRPKKHEPWCSTDTYDLRAGWNTHNDDRRIELDGNWELDELVIDDWFHIEQMGVRDWWLRIGNGGDYWHVNIRIDRDGKAHVTMEYQP